MRRPHPIPSLLAIQPPADSARLMLLGAVFTVAPLIVVGALWGITVIDTWWALAVGFAIHLVTTVIVFWVVFFALSDSAPNLRRPRGRRRAARRAPPAGGERGDD